MKRTGKILPISLAVFCLLLVALINFTIGWRPIFGPEKRDTTSRQFERTPERLLRGRYLTQSILGCEVCHSPRQWSQHGAPMVAGKEMAGQALDFAGLPGTVTANNVTPDSETGAGSWSDDQIARAIREGIRHDGSTIFPIMPYGEYRQLSDEDTASVVVYLRSLPAVHNELPATHIKFPVHLLIRSAPEPVTGAVAGPNPNDSLARGKYLVSLGCGCHTPSDKLAFGGGEVLQGPWGEAASANITSDPSGIGYYSEAMFITALRTGYVGARKLNSIMPFGDFKNLTDDDLKAIFAYLRSVPAVRHHVDNSLPATYCKICKQKHGGGDQN